MLKNRCDECDKTRCIITSDPIKGKANLMYCRKEWDRFDVDEFLSKNGWTKRQIEDYWDYDPSEDREYEEAKE